MRKRVAVVNKIHPDAVARLRERFDVTDFLEVADEALRAQALRESHAIVVRSFRITGELLDTMPYLRAIVKRGVGYNDIDVPAATQRGIVVTNTPGGNATSVVEGTIALMLCALRGMRQLDEHVRAGRYAVRLTWPMGDLWGKKIGIIGFGDIGRRVAQVCGRGFEMEVSAYDPRADAAALAALGVKKSGELMQLMRESDVVSVHCPLTSETRGMIGARELAAMKPTAILVNAARGAVVDEDALVEVLRGHKIRAAGIDVYTREPPSPDSPLLQLDNVALTPHNAGSSEGGMLKAGMMAAQAVEDLLAGKRVYCLNPEVWERPNLRAARTSAR